jgi:hypothetical protein
MVQRGVYKKDNQCIVLCKIKFRNLLTASIPKHTYHEYFEMKGPATIISKLWNIIYSQDDYNTVGVFVKKVPVSYL